MKEKVKLNYESIAKEVIKNVGGKENIQSAAHCATRLRFIVVNKSKIDEKAFDDIDGVKGVFFNSGQFQIILGTGVVDKVYSEVVKLGVSETAKEEVRQAKDKESNSIQRAIRTFGDIFVSIIPVLVATGLFLGLKGVLFNQYFLDLFGLSASEIPETVLVLMDVLTATTFAFIPSLVCYSTFRVFGGTPMIGLILGLMLVSPSLPNAYSVADPNSGVSPLYLFNFIPIVGYQGSVLPAFVAGFIGTKLEKKLRQVISETFDFFVTPFIVLLVMMILSLMVIGPVLHGFEQVLLTLIESIVHLPLGIGGFIIGFLWSPIVLTGVHHISSMLEISLLASTGFNPFNAIITMGGFANAAVCLAVALRAKKKSIRAMGTGATVSSLLGIGEPALFGIILRYSIKPFMILCLASGIGGMASSLLGLQGTGNGVSTVPGVLLYMYSPYQFLGYIGVAVATFAIAFVLTWLFATPKQVLEEV